MPTAPARRRAPSLARALAAHPVAVLVTAVTILSSVAAAVMVERSGAQTSAEALAGLERLADAQAVAADHVLEAAIADVTLAARQPLYGDLLAREEVDVSERERVNAALVYLASRQTLDTLALVRADGQELARVDGGVVATPAQLLRDARNADPALGPALTMTPGQAYRSDPYVSVTSGRYVFGVATPIMRDLRRVGVLYVEVPLVAVEAALTAIPVGPQDYAFIMDKAGHLLVHPNLAAFRSASGIDPLDPAAPLPEAVASGDPSWQSAVGRILSGTEAGTPFVDTAGPARYAARPILGGSADLVVVSPESALFASVERSRNDILLVLGPLAAIIVLLTFGFSLRLAKANRRLGDAMAASARLAAIVESAEDAILSVDRDGRVVTVNAAAERQLATTSSEIIGRPLVDLVPADLRPEIERHLDTVATGEAVPRFELDVTGAEGERAALSITYSPIHDEGGDVVAASVIARDISDLKRLEEQLAHQALHDTLTGMPNRALFRDRLDHALRRGTRSPIEISNGSRMAVLFVDLDDFKIVNDTLGHRVGDELLVEVGRRIAASIRPGDTAARLGGDEFTVLLDGVEDAAEARLVADRLLEKVTAPFHLHGHDVLVGASIGIALGGATGVDPDEILRSADTALYAAKGKGKGQHATFDPAMDRGAWRRLELESDLRKAIGEDQFEVHYQPIVELATGTVREVEALVRWRHPQRGLVAPGDFIPIAEQTGLIVPIGRSVLRQALTDLVAWRAARPEFLGIGVSVNISPRELQRADLTEAVHATLAEVGLPLSALRLEITEGLELEDGPSIERLLALRAGGARISIDDFGTGYASLSAFKRLPIDGLKIDKSFVSAIGEVREETAIVTAAVSLASALGVDATGEGIETADQYRRLLELGCRFGQGYLIGRPAPASAIAAMSLTVPLPASATGRDTAAA